MVPRLIHPIEVSVERVDVAATPIDPEFREPTGEGVRFLPPVVLPAQITWGTKDELRRSSGGDQYQADGHFTFLRADLDARGLQLHKGDRVFAEANQTYHYRIVSVEPAGHYHGRPHLVRAMFRRLEGND
jgi:hypothetical protein